MGESREAKRREEVKGDYKRGVGLFFVWFNYLWISKSTCQSASQSICLPINFTLLSIVTIIIFLFLSTNQSVNWKQMRDNSKIKDVNDI